MAPGYKLIYFPVKVLAEPIRFLLSYGKLEFEDFRFSMEDWPNYKPLMPFGKTPVLEFDGIQAYQSIAICRYLAKQLKIAGTNDLENLEIDAIVDTIVDFRNKIALYYYEKEDIIKEQLKKTVFEETLPYYLTRLETVAKSNNGYLATGKLTWADIYFVSLIDYLSVLIEKKLIEKCPTLLKLEKKILNFPGIKEWVAKRPITDV